LPRKAIIALLFTVFLIALCGAKDKPLQIIFIDAEIQQLYLYEDRRLIASYPCAVGKTATPSPIGVWKVNGKAENWGDGFGTRFISIDCPWGRYGIHGTDKPQSIGGHTSHGCIRMRNEDVEKLYERVRVGAKVVIERSGCGNMAAGLRNLRPGDRGSDVYEVQKRLINAGYMTGIPDGIFGNGTKEALLRFMRDHDLQETDCVDRAVYQRLGILLFD